MKGKIARFASFGAFVELGENLEGLCHISELSDERVEKAEDAAQLGQEMEFKILRIDAENKKIGLSARAVGHDEPIVETKVYTSEAGGGMASLGELTAGIAREIQNPLNFVNNFSEVSIELASELRDEIKRTDLSSKEKENIIECLINSNVMLILLN